MAGARWDATCRNVSSMTPHNDQQARRRRTAPPCPGCGRAGQDHRSTRSPSGTPRVQRDARHHRRGTPPSACGADAGHVAAVLLQVSAICTGWKLGRDPEVERRGSSASTASNRREPPYRRWICANALTRPRHHHRIFCGNIRWLGEDNGHDSRIVHAGACRCLPAVESCGPPPLGELAPGSAWPASPRSPCRSPVTPAQHRATSMKTLAEPPRTC